MQSDDKFICEINTKFKTHHAKRPSLLISRHWLKHWKDLAGLIWPRGRSLPNTVLSGNSQQKVVISLSGRGTHAVLCLAVWFTSAAHNIFEICRHDQKNDLISWLVLTEVQHYLWGEKMGFHNKMKNAHAHQRRSCGWPTQWRAEGRGATPQGIEGRGHPEWNYKNLNVVTRWFFLL